MTCFSPCKGVLEFCEFVLGRGTSQITIVTRPPESQGATLRRVEAEQIEVAGVDLRIRKSPDLHSKIYFFAYDDAVFAAFIGSANFTKGGFEDNDETMTMIQNLEDRPEVQRELNRLTMFGSYPYSSWKAIRA